MKISKWVLLFLWVMIASCSSGGQEESATPAVSELSLGQTVTGGISTVGKVDTYFVNVVDANSMLTVSCNEAGSGSGVDLMITAYSEDSQGNRRRMFGKHKPVDASRGADLEMNLFIDEPKRIYLTVRDLMDDEASTIPYRLRVDLSPRGDIGSNFASAVDISLNGDVTTGSIVAVGDRNSYRFQPSADGVYAVRATNPQQSAVTLSLSLFDRQGNPIMRQSGNDITMRVALTASDGPYYVVASDSSESNRDQISYNIWLDIIGSVESMQNDTPEAAQTLASEGTQLVARGNLDYGASNAPPQNSGDVDWYRLNVPQSAEEYRALRATVDDGEGDEVVGIRIVTEILNAATLAPVATQEFTSGGDALTNQFRLAPGDYLVRISPEDPESIIQSIPYMVALEIEDVNDAIEEDDDNTTNTAVLLIDTNSSTVFPVEAGSPVNSSISYAADVDYFRINVYAGTPKILSVELTSATSLVDYRLIIQRGTETDDEVKRQTDTDGSDGATRLKTSVLVPQADPAGVVAYYIRVSDAQNNEGDSVPYALTARLEDIPVSVDAIEGTVPIYYSEAAEPRGADGTYEQVELEIMSNNQPTFAADKEVFNFRTHPDYVDSIIDGEGNLTSAAITFPWVAGYIDYQGDHDFFKMDFGKLDSAGTETAWYYDVNIRLVVPGSAVEYVWKLYRDRNSNHIIMDDPTSPDGYKACDGDMTPSDVSGGAIDQVLPRPGSTGSDSIFIIPSVRSTEDGGQEEWGLNNQFFLGISDFIYQTNLDITPVPTWPENDWGYDAPYYLKVTLTYHPGQSQPD